MIVTFISQCEKKALNRTRRVLDAFAERIGERTWQTVITEEGLLAVKKLLRKTVTKNTAVACHWIRSRSRTELIWIVGNRKKFNAQGVVPVNRSKRNRLHSDWENGWTFLPALKALVAVSALLHDWGKANKLFQEKLTPKSKSRSKTGDPFRHEWISCLLLCALVDYSGDRQSDEAWLSLLAEGCFEDSALECLVQTVSSEQEKPLANLPPLARMVAWLILSHHRLPALHDKNSCGDKTRESIDELLTSIKAEWGYQNKYDDEKYTEREAECFTFLQGLMLVQTEEPASVWQKQLTKWTKRLLLEQNNVRTLLENGSWRIVLQHARLCLMLGDHYYSSCDADCSDKWQDSLYANTDKNHKLKQKLDEHLVNVSRTALKVSQALFSFSTEMAVAHDVHLLRAKSPEAYKWQDTAVSKITAFRKQHEAVAEKGYGWFVVNMASTGCGKTTANAKIMRALSDDGDSLRYVLALGLRTLTLQTGDEYRERIQLEDQQLATLIGSSAIKALHEQAKQNNEDEDEDASKQYGSDSEESLLDEDFGEDDIKDYDLVESVTAQFLNAILKRPKDKALLYIPVLVCTIDHIIGATETTRGGKYILPYLRLLSSDLVIDEVDDFDGQDLIAIGRLIHLAGMLGRKVVISSATIPPAVAEGLFNAYQAGWQLHSQLHKTLPQVACVWTDENSSQADFIKIEATTEQTCGAYKQLHQKFTAQRAKFLHKQIVKRKGMIVPCQELFTEKPDKTSYEPAYFEKIKQTAIQLHQWHHAVDKKTQKKVSFGVVRVASIPPCINVAKYLIQAEWAEDFAPKVMAYHSRQVLLLRHEQEQHLDTVLKRKQKNWVDFDEPIIRGHLDTTPEQNILFIVVATPVEEVGRDHDFDWAVIEPSSYRSIIQLAGRVLRHREQTISQPNIAIMQYNLRALRQGNKQEKVPGGRLKKSSLVFCRPGYESPSFFLNSRDLLQLVNEAEIAASINALPRVLEPDHLNIEQKQSEKLIDLEHKSLNYHLKNYQATGPKYLQAWLTECWWMTALPQQFNRFRESVVEVILSQYLCSALLLIMAKSLPGIHRLLTVFKG